MTLYDEARTHHARLLRLASLLARSAGDEPQRRHDLLTRLAFEVDLARQLRRDRLYPLLAGYPRTGAIISSYYGEWDELEENLQQLHRCAPDRPGFQNAVTRLVGVLHRFAQREARELLPLAERTILQARVPRPEPEAPQSRPQHA